MLFILFFIGLFGAALNTLPPSATNLAVVKYTVDLGFRKALSLANGAATGEVFIAGLALSFGVLVKRLYENNLWIQITFISILMLAGIYFVYKGFSSKETSDTDDKTPPRRFVNGFLLGGLNIPMFIYWTALFSLLSQWVIIDDGKPWHMILSFLGGVFLGKLGILFLYGKLSDYMEDNFSTFKNKLDYIIGLVLVSAAVIQIVKLSME